MALVEPNFDDVPEDVGPGVYKVIVKKGEIKSWPSGDQYVRWEMETTGDSTPKNNGRRIFVNTSVSGKGVFMLQRLYRAAVGQSLTGSFDTEQLTGKQLEVELVQQVRDGQTTQYTDVKKFSPISAT